MKAYLVTGGAGFIGSHIVEELVRRGEKVRVLDNFLTGKRENIDKFLDRVELIEGDVRDYAACERAVVEIDFVLHQAALPSVPRSIEDPLTADEINVRGTLNMLLASARAGVKRFVFASSSSVYGDEPTLPKKEGREGSLLSPYAVTKHAGEKYCRVFSAVYGLSTVCLRYFNIFGPRQDPFSQYAAVIPNFITAVLAGRSPVIHGDGEQSRDFTYVANVVEANLLAAGAEGPVSGAVFNIACGERITVNALAAAVNELTEISVRPIHEAPRPGDIRHSFADIGKAGALLGYEPRIGFHEGLRRTILWYRDMIGTVRRTP